MAVSTPIALVGFTPTERRILELLADGLPHRREEVLLCLDDELADYTHLSGHIKNARRKLLPLGYDVVCQVKSFMYSYRWVRVLHPPQSEGVSGSPSDS